MGWMTGVPFPAGTWVFSLWHHIRPALEST